MGSNTRRLLEDVTAALATRLINRVLSDAAIDEGRRLPDRTSENPEDRLSLDALKSIDNELQGVIEFQCQRVIELASAKGARSLATIAAEKALHNEHEMLEQQLDDACRSCWAYLEVPHVFADAESFHRARQDRDRGRIYSAYSLDLDEIIPKDAESVKEAALTEKLRSVLALQKSPTVSAIDLPATHEHPKSVMLVIRHGGPLSSVYDHGEKGERKPLYYRPQNEAVVIYTAENHLIEICGSTFGVRHEIANVFAELELGQNVSAQPLSEKVYDLGRFTDSFVLELPHFDDVEIRSADVLEFQLLLGGYGRRISLKVTKEDDIEELARRYMADAMRFRSGAGINKVTISVGYRRPGEGRTRALSITVLGTNGSTIQNHGDPVVRALGARLLQAWGISRSLKPLDQQATNDMLLPMLVLFDLGQTVVSGFELRELGLSVQELLDARLIFQKRRQATTLVDEDDTVVEVDLSPGEDANEVVTPDDPGSGATARSARDFTDYQLAEDWFHETLTKTIGSRIDRQRIEAIGANLFRVGDLNFEGKWLPVYLARRMTEMKVADAVESELRSRHSAGSGIVLCAGREAPRYIGPNVAMPVQSVWVTEGDVSGIDSRLLLDRYSADRALLTNGMVTMVLRGGAHTGSFIMPLKLPLTLSSAKQLTFFERLADAHNSGAAAVHSKELLEGMSEKTPREVFTGTMRARVFDEYVEKVNKGFWRLKP